MRWFGDWMENPQKASKIVNDDGTPRIVYYKSEDAQNGVYHLTETENGGEIGIFYLDTKNETTSKIAKRVSFPIQPTKDVASGIILHQVPEKVNLMAHSSNLPIQTLV